MPLATSPPLPASVLTLCFLPSPGVTWLCSCLRPTSPFVQGPLSTYSQTRIFSLPPVSPSSRFSPGPFPSVHVHTRAAISPSLKIPLTPLASLIATLFICPLYRKPPKAVLDPSLVPRLPFLPEPALIRLLFPHSTKTAIRNAPRSSLWPNPQTLCR